MFAEEMKIAFDQLCSFHYDDYNRLIWWLYIWCNDVICDHFVITFNCYFSLLQISQSCDFNRYIYIYILYFFYYNNGGKNI